MFITFIQFVNSTHYCVDIIIIHTILSYESCEMAALGGEIMIFTQNVMTVRLKSDSVSRFMRQTNRRDNFVILNIICHFKTIRNTSLCKRFIF